MKALNPHFEWLEIHRLSLEGANLCSDMNIDKLLPKLYKGELIFLQTNNQEINMIGYAYLDDSLCKNFFIYYAWGNNLMHNIDEIVDYLKNTHGCQKASFQSNTYAHHKLYRKILNKIRYKESLTFNVELY